MKKLVDAALVAALLMISCPEPLSRDLPDPPIVQVTEASHGDRPC